MAMMPVSLSPSLPRALGVSLLVVFGLHAHVVSAMEGSKALTEAERIQIRAEMAAMQVQMEALRNQLEAEKRKRKARIAPEATIAPGQAAPKATMPPRQKLGRIPWKPCVDIKKQRFGYDIIKNAAKPAYVAKKATTKPACLADPEAGAMSAIGQLAGIEQARKRVQQALSPEQEKLRSYCGVAGAIHKDKHGKPEDRALIMLTTLNTHFDSEVLCRGGPETRTVSLNALAGLYYFDYGNDVMAEMMSVFTNMVRKKDRKGALGAFSLSPNGDELKWVYDDE